MNSETKTLAALALEFQRRRIATTIGQCRHIWADRPILTLTGPEYLGGVQVTVNSHQSYRWLDRHGHVQVRPAGDAQAAAAQIIQDRAGTLSPPEPDPDSPEPPRLPLPRRKARRPGSVPPQGCGE